MIVKIFLLPLSVPNFLQLFGSTNANRLGANLSETGIKVLWLFNRKLTPCLTDSSGWRQKGVGQYLPQTHITGNACLSFLFDDVSHLICGAQIHGSVFHSVYFALPKKKNQVAQIAMEGVKQDGLIIMFQLDCFCSSHHIE